MEGRTREFIQRYTFADFFDRLFAMLRHTWKTSIFGGLIFVGTPAVILGLMVPALFSNLGEVIEGAETMGEAQARSALTAMLGWNGGLLLVGIATAVLAKLAALAVVHRTRDAIFDRQSSWRGCIRDAFRNSLWPVIVQNLLKGLIVFGVVLVPTLLIVLASAVGGGGTAALVIGMVIVSLGAGIAITWIFYALLLAEHAVVFDSMGIVTGMKKSNRLVLGNWWRLFGITLLLGIALSFATGLITTPIMGASMLPMAGRMLEAGFDGEMNDAEIVRVLSGAGGFGIAIAIGTIIQQLAALLIMPVFTTLFYVDLKVRAGELPLPQEATPPDPTDDEESDRTGVPPE